MEVLIITGMSGAGKTAVLNLCQDNDYYTLDNLPPTLISQVIELLESSNISKKLAMVIDIRGKEFFNSLMEEVTKLRMSGNKVKILYVDSSDEVLIRRYKELRRPHPQGKELTIEEAIEQERQIMKTLKEQANYYLDTSDFNMARLRLNISKIIGSIEKFEVRLVSFGFKYGVLEEADLIFDARFSPNPFYVQKLKAKNGYDEEVKNYVLERHEVEWMIDHVDQYVQKLSKYYLKEGKTVLTIGIGCTGGKHRSVAIANELNKRLAKFNSTVFHRDSNMW